MDHYSILGTAIIIQMILSAVAFGYTGWNAARRAMPFTSLFGYVCAFATAGLAGITAQLVYA